MKRFSAVACVIVSGITLSACSNVGNTYGTGSSHELATLKGLSSMFNLRAQEKAKIDYTPRPDLIMPANKNVLPAPADASNVDDQNWPVSPLERQAAVQNAAPAADNRTRNPGGLDAEFATSEKQGIFKQIENRTARYDPSVDNVRATGATEVLREIQQGKNKNNRQAALARKEQLTYTRGSGARRFLTEPPVEYRTPAATADAGELGVSNEVLDERQKREAQIAKDAERGIITPNVN